MPSVAPIYFVNGSQLGVAATASNVISGAGPQVLAGIGLEDVRLSFGGPAVWSDDVRLTDKRNGAVSWTRALALGWLTLTGATRTPRHYIDGSGNHRSAMTVNPIELKGPDGDTIRYGGNVRVWSSQFTLASWNAAITAGTIVLEGP